MQINKVAFIGKGGVGLLYGSMIARALGDDAVEFVMERRGIRDGRRALPAPRRRPAENQR